jgi:type II secretory ATPase GspE/PulE/Tfp pilus assembly ATPase PilB-like protein
MNLRACARELATAERHVMSVSNTGHTWLPGIENLISDGSDAHFSELLQLAFRHKPDVLLVDAVEKPEHRDICLRQSIKGPLVLTHTYARDAAEALVAMVGVNSEPALVGDALLGIVAQRALRLTCPRCQEKDSIHRDRVRDMGIPLSIQPPAFFRGKGCDSCLKTGFDRETNIFEIIVMTDMLRSLINKKVSPDDIRAYFKNSNLLTLRQMAVHKAINGQTSLAEVLRVTP